jgi:hypothetical protein
MPCAAGPKKSLAEIQRMNAGIGAGFASDAERQKARPWYGTGHPAQDMSLLTPRAPS